MSSKCLIHQADLTDVMFKETFPLMVRAMLQHRLLSICKHLCRLEPFLDLITRGQCWPVDST